MPARNSSMELSSPSNPDADNHVQPSRRKSGRVSKAPEYLTPSSQANGAKRKRPSPGEDEVDVSDESSSSSEGEPDEEELREKRRRTKKKTDGKAAAKKRPKINGTIALPVRTTAARPKKAKKGAMRPSAAGDQLNGLYGKIFAAGDSLDDVAAAWIQRFDEHQANAVTEIVNLLLRAAGCEIEVNTYDIEDPDNAASKLTDIQDEYQAQNISEYPLIAKSKGAATFKKTLAGFFDSLVKSMAASSLLFSDPDLIENIHVWVSSMSSASNRPFRHTATLVGLSVVSALCEVGAGLVNNRAKFLRQYEGEQKKKNANKNRLNDFKSQADNAQDRTAQLESIIKDWVDTIFVHRVRDIDYRIRVECVIHLSDWIMTYPDLFFEPHQLRYLGWLVSDPAVQTRQEVLKQLQRLYRDESKLPGLRNFTDRFRPRIIEVALRDAEPSLRASAIALLDVFRDAGLLEPDDIDTIGPLIYDAESGVRKSIAPFFVGSVQDSLFAKVEDLGGNDALEEGLPDIDEDDYERPRFDWLQLKCLSEMLNSFDPDDEIQHKEEPSAYELVAVAGVDSRYSLAAQEIFVHMEELRKWEILAGFLLFDHSQTTQARGAASIEAQLVQQCKLDEKEEIILLDVLNTIVKLSLAEVVEEAKEQKRGKKSKAQRQEQEERQEVAAQKLAILIPKLLNKFGAAPEAATSVLRLQRTLNLEIFQELRQDSTTYATLLDNIKSQFMTHKTHSVLAEASAALLHARGFEGLDEITETRMQTLWEDTTLAFVTLCKGQELSARGSIDYEPLDRIADTVLRISNLAQISDCVDALDKPKTPVAANKKGKQRASGSSDAVEPIRILIDMLGRGRPGSHVLPEVNQAEDDLVRNIMNTVLCYFLWHVQRLRSDPADRNLDELLERRDEVVRHLHTIVASRPGADDLRIAAAQNLLDLHTAFTVRPSATEEDASSIAPLSMELSEEAETSLLKLLSALEREYAKKTKKNLEDPSPDEDPEDLSDEEDDEDESDDESGAPGGDNETEEEHEERERRKQKREESKRRSILLTENKLCTFASRIVMAIIAGVVDKNQKATKQPGAHEGPIQKRLCRNRLRLGQNFKGVLATLDKVDSKNATTKGKGRAKTTKAQAETQQKAKSNALVLSDDEEEDDHDHDQEAENAPEQEEEQTADAASEEGVSDKGPEQSEEPESVVGD